MDGTLEEFNKTYRVVLDRLFQRATQASLAAGWHVQRERFALALHRSVAHRFAGAGASLSADHAFARRVQEFLESLHVEDLALACACAEGDEAAWECFVREYQPILRAAARVVAGESQALELADSLFADLYGLKGEQRRSLFDYFHGRSKLSTWLRAVVAQRHVDSIRAAQRFESLEDGEEEPGPGTKRKPGDRSYFPDLLDPDRGRYLGFFEQALTQAIVQLAPRDRLRLSLYYVQEMTLAEIGRALGESEATTSRKLERTRRALRGEVDRALSDPGGPARLSKAQLQLCYEYAVEDAPFDLARMFSASASRKGETPEKGQPSAARTLR